MGQISNQIFMSAIDDGETIHGSLRSTRSLAQGYSKVTNTYSPNWYYSGTAPNPDPRPVIYLTLMDGLNYIVPSGWSTSNQGAVTWRWNDTILTFDSNGYSTNATYDSHPLFLRTYYSFSLDQSHSIDVPALKIVNNLAMAGNLNADVITIEGNVEMSGEPIGFSASVTVMLGETTADGYYGALEFLNGKSYILTDTDSVECTAYLYQNGAEVSTCTYAWKFNGNTVSTTSTSAQVYIKNGGKTIVVKGDDEKGVLDIATITCTFSVDNNPVLTMSETVDDQGDDILLKTSFEIQKEDGSSFSQEFDGSPVSLHSNQQVVWTVKVVKATDPTSVYNALKFEFMPTNAAGTAMTTSGFSKTPLSTAGKWDSGWCNVSKTEATQPGGGSYSPKRYSDGGFTCTYTDIHAAGKNISGIVRATMPSGNY